MKVAKFGGSSVANAEQLRKVGNIIKSDPKRKFIVVSAPGKRFKNDTKVTDLLIQLGNAYHNQQNYEVFLVAILERFQEIINDLEIDLSLLSEIENNIKVALRVEGKPESKMDAIKAIGEDSSAKILSAYLNQNNISAQYMNPKDAGIFVSEEPGNAQILPESFELLYKLREKDHILVIPGFFGYSKTGKLVTFS